ncbi:MAG: prephenate dehydratase [Chloroflexi bacterium]|nr:prephenate dehydratase [Chloroflexota bacterium]MCL5076348.1 prephenate dehydratase [Chloroflexota bacterium]
MNLDELRQRIDDIDQQIVALLNARAELSLQIGAVKSDNEVNIYVPERERRVYDNVFQANQGPLSKEAIREIYGSILSASRALQRPLRVAYLGPAATFTHEAAKRRFGTAVEFLPARSIAEVFSETEKGESDYGVVPVENSIEGVVTHTLDMFVDSELKICAEVLLAVSHHLLGKGCLADIRKVCSHPQAIAQSRGWLQEHLPSVELVEVASTARAAEMAVLDPTIAAIGTESAADLYGLNILESHIEDSASNITRFLVIGRQMSQRSGDDRTAIMFSIRDRVGALHDTLEIFLKYGINLTKIESRPSKRKLWDYIFFVDLVGHPDDEHVAAALNELSRECVFVKVLGAWPQE